jgi:hypothetical protein
MVGHRIPNHLRRIRTKRVSTEKASILWSSIRSSDDYDGKGRHL